MPLVARTTSRLYTPRKNQPTNVMRLRVLGVTLLRKELFREDKIVVYLLGLPIYQTDQLQPGYPWWAH